MFFELGEYTSDILKESKKTTINKPQRLYYVTVGLLPLLPLQ